MYTALRSPISTMLVQRFPWEAALRFSLARPHIDDTQHAFEQHQLASLMPSIQSAPRPTNCEVIIQVPPQQQARNCCMATKRRIDPAAGKGQAHDRSPCTTTGSLTSERRAGSLSPACEDRDLQPREADQKVGHRGDSNTKFESISLTARTQCHHGTEKIRMLRNSHQA